MTGLKAIEKVNPAVFQAAVYSEAWKVMPQSQRSVKGLGKIARNLLDDRELCYSDNKNLAKLTRNLNVMKEMAREIGRVNKEEAKEAKLVQKIASYGLAAETRALDPREKAGAYVGAMMVIAGVSAGVGPGAISLSSNLMIALSRNLWAQDGNGYLFLDQMRKTGLEGIGALADFTGDKGAKALVEAAPGGGKAAVHALHYGSLKGQQKQDVKLLSSTARVWGRRPLSDHFIITQRAEVASDMEETLELIGNLSPRVEKNLPNRSSEAKTVKKIVDHARRQGSQEGLSEAARIGIYQGALAVISALEDKIDAATIPVALEELDQAASACEPLGAKGEKNSYLAQSGLESLKFITRSRRWD